MARFCRFPFGFYTVLQHNIYKTMYSTRFWLVFQWLFNVFLMFLLIRFSFRSPLFHSVWRSIFFRRSNRVLNSVDGSLCRCRSAGNPLQSAPAPRGRPRYGLTAPPRECGRMYPIVVGVRLLCPRWWRLTASSALAERKTSGAAHPR